MFCKKGFWVCFFLGFGFGFFLGGRGRWGWFGFVLFFNIPVWIVTTHQIISSVIV